MRRAWSGFACLVLAGCGSGSVAEQAPAPAPAPEVDSGCGPREAPLEEGGCGPIGPKGGPCAPGEALLDSGECRAAGIPPEACGKGFLPDGAGGCEPVLPAAPCMKGQMAIPGETACREVAPCAAGTWGDIPVDATTQFVDAAYAGTDADGSATKPWTTVTAAVAAAAPGAIVAIAAGSYTDVVVKDKPVRLWGRCPGLVSIVGGGYGVQVLPGASGTEIRDLAVTGIGQPWAAIGVAEVTNVTLDRVWVHDVPGQRGLDLTDDDPQGSAEVTVKRSLIEGTSLVAVMVWSAELTLEETVVRDTGTSVGRGMVVAMNPAAKVPAAATVRSCVFERSLETGILVSGADLTVDGSVVRSTTGMADGTQGRGIVAFASEGVVPHVTIRSSVIADGALGGVGLLGTEATIENTVVRDTHGQKSDGNYGTGIVAAPQDGLASTLTLVSSLIDSNKNVALYVGGSDASVASTIVRGTAGRSVDGMYGWGLAAVVAPDTQQRANVKVTASRFEQNTATGIGVSGSDVEVEDSVVRDTLPQTSDSNMGYGIWADEGEGGVRSKLVVRGSLVDHCAALGIAVVGSDAVLEEVTVEDTEAQASDQRLGIGISFDRRTQRAAGTITSSLVRTSRMMGVHAWDADLEMATTVVEATQGQAGNGEFGDGVFIEATVGPSTFSAHRSAFAQSSRVGLSSFGSVVKLGFSVLDCNEIHLDGESTKKLDYSFEDLGHNWCGCSRKPDVCKVLSSSLVPPGGLPPVQSTTDPEPGQGF